MATTTRSMSRDFCLRCEFDAATRNASVVRAKLKFCDIVCVHWAKRASERMELSQLCRDAWPATN